jgi:cytochrome c553
LASIVRGGRLYDNWSAETGRGPPPGPHPAYPAAGARRGDAAGTWRCKECHGWDYRGRDGAYGTGRHFTGIAGIRHMVGADPAAVIAVLRDTTHGYGPLLGEGALRDLANFVARGQLDMDRVIDRASRRARGDASRRQSYFHTICATCHGQDGRRITTMPALGHVARDHPWEALHKILNGHPDEKMPALRVLDLQVLVDILAHIQTLPAAK